MIVPKIGLQCSLFIVLLFSIGTLSQSCPGIISEIHQSNFESIVSNVITLAPFPDVLFVQTAGGHLYRSADYGKTFVDQSTTLPNWVAGTNINIVRKSYNDDTIFIAGKGAGVNGKMWTSKDGGASYTYFISNQQPLCNFTRVLPNPVNSSLVTAVMEVPVQGVSATFLFFSVNGGLNWDLCPVPINGGTGTYTNLPIPAQTGWGAAGISPYGEKEHFGIWWNDARTETRFYTSTDMFNFNYKREFENLYIFKYAYLRNVQKWLFHVSISPDVQLLVLPTDLTQSIVEVQFDPSVVIEGVFDTINVQDNAVLLVSYAQTGAAKGHLIFASAFNQQFTTVLDNYYTPDIAILPKNNSILFASRIDASFNLLGTLWSNDNGKTWGPISIPDSGSCTGCTLKILSSAFSPVTSFFVYQSYLDTSLIFVNGNIGTVYSGTLSDYNLYRRTPDANWVLVSQGPHLVTTLDNIDWIITTTLSASPTNTLAVSKDLGATFTTCQFVADPSTYVVKFLETLANDTLLISTQGPGAQGSLFYVKFNTVSTPEPNPSPNPNPTPNPTGPNPIGPNPTGPNPNPNPTGPNPIGPNPTGPNPNPNPNPNPTGPNPNPSPKTPSPNPTPNPTGPNPTGPNPNPNPNPNPTGPNPTPSPKNPTPNPIDPKPAPGTPSSSVSLAVLFSPIIILNVLLFLFIKQ